MPSTSIHIDASPEDVWALVSDITRMGDWSPETKSAEWVDGATSAVVGARFKGSNKRKAPWSTTCTITEAEPGRCFAFSVGKGETTWRYDLAPSPSGGTDITESFEIVKAPGAVGKALTKLGTGMPWSEREADLVKGMEHTLARIKAAAEAS
ncbi:MAG TPA: SRPBCC family protein [Acidimicrobiales bacterium]|nr:SRPBCC family protein [Acidimicrobiales bacterium]